MILRILQKLRRIFFADDWYPLRGSGAKKDEGKRHFKSTVLQQFISQVLRVFIPALFDKKLGRVVDWADLSQISFAEK